MLLRLIARRLPSRARWIHHAREVKEDPRWPGYEVVIGIETHVQLKSRQKLFSRMFFSSGCQL